MRRLLPASLLVAAAVSGGIEFGRHCPGCIDRSRVNSSCEWTGDTAFPIDAGNPAHRQHLVADAQLAEDLAIRHGDAEFKRLYGYEAHGGLIDQGRVVRDCMARLVAAIGDEHAVTREQVARARGQRNSIFDSAAALSFVPVFLFGAGVASRRLRRRFSAERRAVRVVAIGLASGVVTLLGLQVGQLWLGVWESVRVRNGHMSPFRAATDTAWPHHHAGALLAAGVIAFWLVAISPRRLARQVLLRKTAMLMCIVLAATFADIFVQHAVGYAIVVAALVVCWQVASGVERVADASPQGVLLH